MSWLGDSWSSITGQITNLTKEVLTDGTEEVSDHITELRIANGKIQELETAYNIQRQEIERFKIINAELEEKAESTELQINTISREYRAMLEKKEEEIKRLKQKQNEFEDFQKKILVSDSTPVLSTKNSSYYTDDMDFGDVIESQHEINRLVGQVQRLKAECEHWKLLANSNQGVLDGSLPSAEVHNCSHYQAEIKALQGRYQNEVDQHQHQLAALQDHHRQKVTVLQKKHDEELAQYQLLLQSQNTDAVVQPSPDMPHSPSDNKALQNQLLEIQNLHDQVSQLDAANMKLKVELEHSSLSEKEKTRTLQVLSRQLEALQAEKTKVIQERDSLCLNQKQLKDDLKRISQENRKNQEEMKRLDTLETNGTFQQSDDDTQQSADEKELGDQNKTTADLVKSLQREMDFLRKKNDELENQMNDLDESLMSVVEDKEQADEIIIKLNKQIRLLQEQIPDMKRTDSECTLGNENETDNFSNNIPHKDWSPVGSDSPEGKLDSSIAGDFDELETSSTVSETSLKNHELEYQVRTLQAQINTYERDIEHFELVKPEWQVEKEDLENVISKLREQLQEKESRLSVLTAKRGLIELEKNNSGEWAHVDRESICSGDIDAHLDNFQRDIDELTQANAQLEHERDILVEEKEELFEELQKLQLLVKLNPQTSDSSSSPVKTIEMLLESLSHLNHSLQVDSTSSDSHKIMKALQNLIYQNQHLFDLHNNVRANEQLNEITEKLELATQQIDTDKDKLSQELEMSLEKILILEKNLQDEKNEKDSLNHKLVIMNEQLQIQSTWSNEKEQLLSEVDRLNNKIQQSSSMILELHKEGAELQETLTTLKAQNIDLTNMKQEYESKQTSLCNEVQELQTRILQNEDKNKNTKSILTLENEVLNLNSVINQLQNEQEEKQLNIENLETQIISLAHDKENLSTKYSEIELKHSSQKQEENQYIQELTTQIESLRMQKKDLEEELNETEFKLGEQAKQYENTIHRLSQSKELDSSSLQVEHEKIVKESHEREKHISELNTMLQQRTVELSETKEMLKESIEGQGQLQEVIHEKEKDIEFLKHESVKIHKTVEDLTYTLTAQEPIMKKLQSLENNLDLQIEENRKLKLSLECSIKPDTKTLDIITELEVENRSLSEQLAVKEQEALQLQEIIFNNKSTVQMNGNMSETDNDEIDDDVIQKQLHLKDQQLYELVNRLEIYRSYLDPDILKRLDENGEPTKLLNKINVKYRNDSEVKGLDELKVLHNKSEENMKRLLAAKDKEISLLKEKNVIWLGDEDIKNGYGDFQSLSQQIHYLQTEKEQMMSILNEKTRECSSLKSELHRLMNALSSERATVARLHQKNQELSNRKEAPDQEMTKEAVHNLSRIIQDKDLEIQALKQKNDTLVAVLQESSPNDVHFQTVLQDRENLMKQLGSFQNEREQIIAMLNQKHQESMMYHAEIQRLNSVLFSENDKNDKLQQELNSVSQLFEDKQKGLVNAQNDIISLRQRVTDLEQKYHNIRTKYDEKIQNEKSDSMILIDKKDAENKEEEVIKMNETIKDKDRWLLEKDLIIHDKTLQLQRLEDSCKRKEEEVVSLKRQIENQVVERESYQLELNSVKSENDLASEKLNDQSSEISMMKETNNKLTMTLKEKEFELGAIMEKVLTLTKLVQEKDIGNINMQQILHESEAMQKQAQVFQQERDNVILALNQRQNENKELQQEVRSLKEKNLRLNKELERLRTHLIQIEDSYTREALHAEEREKEIRNRLAITEERLLSSSSAVHNASYQASLQVESLQEQLHAIAEQRDNALLELSIAQEQVHQYSTSLANLQMVLEQFQKEKENQFSLEIEKYQKELQESKSQAEISKKQAKGLQVQYDLAAEALDAAQRLSEQVDKKQEVITALQMEVKERDENIEKAQDLINKLRNTHEGKVDKLVIKNLFLNYFISSQNKRAEILRVLGSVLNFNKEEMQKVTGEKPKTSWMSSILGSNSQSPLPPQTPIANAVIPPINPDANKSFSQLFVKFLEMESTPKIQHVLRLPAEEMAKETQRKSHGSTVHSNLVNPFTASVYGTSNTSSGNSHLLMKPIPETLPTFTPLPPSRETPSSILKDVLQR